MDQKHFSYKVYMKSLQHSGWKDYGSQTKKLQITIREQQDRSVFFVLVKEKA